MVGLFKATYKPIFALIITVIAMRSRLLSLSLLLAAVMVSFSFTTLNSRKFKVRTIVIDAGHGGKDPGTMGSRTRESRIALAIALKVGGYLEENLKDVKVVYTRKTDVFVELIERASLANRHNADLFLSIHCNSNNSKHIHGSETYIMGLHTTDGNLDVAKRENSVILQEDNYLEKYDGFDPSSPIAHIVFANFQNAHMTNSLRLAESIESQFSDRAGRHSRGVKQAGFVVLWRTTMPSALVETGFLSNKADENYLATEQGQVLTASAIYRAVKDYKSTVETE